jgi:hypothetical protein
MGNSLTAGGIPQLVLDQTFLGLESNVTSLIDQVGTRIDVPNISGKLPTEGLEGGLARGDSNALLAEGASPRTELMSFSTTSYNCEKAVGLAQIPDGVRTSYGRSYNYDILERAADLCVRRANLKLDLYTDTVLKSTTLNATEAAANAWDTSSGTPIADMQDAFDKSGDGDIVVIGRDVAQALALNSEFISRTANFDAGAVGPGEIAQLIRAWFPHVRQVVIGSNLYNSANPADSVTLTYAYNGLAWVGHQRDLILTEHGSPAAATQRDEIDETELIRYTRRVDVVRPHQAMGCVITSVVS